jgi:protein phosphatase
VVLARNAEAAAKRFGVEDGKAGVVFTRTGRAFFNDDGMERAIIARLIAAAEAAGIWERLATDWLCLDAELMPWSAKAQALIDSQYRPAGEAGMAGTGQAAQLMAQAAGRGVDIGGLVERFATRAANASAYDTAWRHYVRPVASIDDLRLAPFHLLASETAVHTDRPHDWHMALAAEFCSADPALIISTPNRIIDLGNPEEIAAATEWWESLTASGGEGMVIKPLDFITRGKRGIIQPAIKCRGPEYLRIIYGPDYTMPDHLERLRERGLAAKRGLALREFALGVEALDRFIKREPLRRVHECVFAVLALESEPVDPRL